MYVWIWHKLPGTTTAKAVQVAFLIAAVCAILLFVVFPVIEPHLPFTHVTVDNCWHRAPE